jgi:hypothetical protein
MKRSLIDDADGNKANSNTFKDILQEKSLVNWNDQKAHKTNAQSPLPKETNEFVMTPEEFTRFTIQLAQDPSLASVSAAEAYSKFIEKSLPLILSLDTKYAFAADIINSWIKFLINNRYVTLC